MRALAIRDQSIKGGGVLFFFFWEVVITAFDVLLPLGVVVSPLLLTSARFCDEVGTPR